MSIRSDSPGAGAIAIGSVLSIGSVLLIGLAIVLSSLARTAPASANPTSTTSTPSTDTEATDGPNAWLGCWRLVATARDDVPRSAEASPLLCLMPGEDPSSLWLKTVVDGRLVAGETLVVDGSRRAVDDGGCRGWVRSLSSEDRRRLYVTSLTTCMSDDPQILTGTALNLSAASLFVSEGDWIDISVARVGGKRELEIRRYRIVDPDSVRLPGKIRTATPAARIAAAAPLGPDAVIEALRYLDPAIVETMLRESRSSFPLDAASMLRLDEAGVPGPIIDLMLAQSYPGYFAVEDEAVESVNPVDSVHPVDGADPVESRPVADADYVDYWAPWWSQGIGQHGYGYGYVPSALTPGSRSRPRGLAVSGRGYSRVQLVDPPSRGTALWGGIAFWGGGGDSDDAAEDAVSEGPGGDFWVPGNRRCATCCRRIPRNLCKR